MLSETIKSVMLNVIILSVIMPNAVAPKVVLKMSVMTDKQLVKNKTEDDLVSLFLHFINYLKRKVGHLAETNTSNVYGST
jgi:hypothetical protein